MKRIPLLLSVFILVNTYSQQIHNKTYFKQYKKSIKKLNSFLEEENFTKSNCEIIGLSSIKGFEESQELVYTKDSLKIFIILPKNGKWIGPMNVLEDEYGWCDYFSNSVTIFRNKEDFNEIYLLKK